MICCVYPQQKERVIFVIAGVLPASQSHHSARAGVPLPVPCDEQQGELMDSFTGPVEALLTSQGCGVAPAG